MKDKLQKLKEQIHIRGLRNPPKFGSCQHIGFNEEDWNQVAAAVEEYQHADDNRNQEEVKHKMQVKEKL